ncbi:hypothetical protein DBZ36_03985 [Alginatibacterium sediminis]|uniref:Flagellar protein FlaG n=1 Tax=Alginatibacterium sediminis TaxID=2164068 RepID=A0A420EG02_9ALTE|nr:flagellar protein FlaG [Alginatibacterium sediminis]RKF19635.1 hypothetical protein DBZ36_03985 [Alginatibacterium sediminis]
MDTSISSIGSTDVSRDILRDSQKTNAEIDPLTKTSKASEAVEKTEATQTAEVDLKKTEELKEISREAIEDIADSVNTVMETLDRDIRFVIDDKDGEYFTSIVDKNTKELIREIPNQEVRDLAEKLQNYNAAINEVSGLFVDKLI